MKSTPLRTLKAIIASGLALAVAATMAAALAGPLDDARTAIARGDYQTALRLVEPLADQGVAEAQYTLGLMYRDGRGVPRDFAAAYMWLTLAIAQGGEKAKEIRDGLAKRMTHGQIEEATLLVREWRREHQR